MSDTVALALISAAPAILAAVYSIVNNVMINRQTAKLDRHGDQLTAQGKSIIQTNASMKTLEEHTNSLKDQLVKTVGDAQFAAGLKQGEDNPK
jgi:hypothetical protein